MKKVDIRKIYVCQIVKLNDVYYKKTDEDDVSYLMGRRIVLGKLTKRFYEIDQQDISFGLFVKSLTGYKHILTGTKYKLGYSEFASAGEYVINPENIELLTKKERNICVHVIRKYGSYDMDIDVIKALEDRINDNLECYDEEEIEL